MSNIYIQDIWLHIISNLKLKDLLNLRITCKIFKKFVHNCGTDVISIYNYKKGVSIGKIIKNMHFSISDLHEDYLNFTSLLNLKNIKKLFIHYGFIVDYDIKILKNNLINLEELYLYEDSRIRDDGIKYLVNLKKLVYIQNNSIRLHCRISNEGMRHLTNLECLCLDNNETITDEVIERLTKLKKLYLDNDKVITYRSINKLTNLRELYINTGDNRITLSKIKLTNLDYKVIGCF